jgi:hypothetical protein
MVGKIFWVVEQEETLVPDFVIVGWQEENSVIGVYLAVESLLSDTVNVN